MTDGSSNLVQNEKGGKTENRCIPTREQRDDGHKSRNTEPETHNKEETNEMQV